MDVREDAPRNAFLGVVNTSMYTTLDAGVKFELVDDDVATSPFTVEQCSGVIRVGRDASLNHEERATFTPTVSVVEPTSEHTLALCVGTITVADVNEPPTVNATGAPYTLAHSASTNTTLECDAPAVARDLDARDQDRLTARLLPGIGAGADEGGPCFGAQLLPSSNGGQTLRLTLLPNRPAACVDPTENLERRCVDAISVPRRARARRGGRRTRGALAPSRMQSGRPPLTMATRRAPMQVHAGGVGHRMGR